jgi:hypothetical protein
MILGAMMRRSHLGRAGGAGFCAGRNTGLIHDLRERGVSCTPCAAGNRAYVHNVYWFDEFRHSSAFVSVGHATKVWLPWLWGYDVTKYAAFMHHCQRVTEIDPFTRRDELKAALKAMGDTVWPFGAAQVQPQTMYQQMYARITPLLARYASHWVGQAEHRQLASRGILVMCQTVAEVMAVANNIDKLASMDERQVQFMRNADPLQALANAARAVVEDKLGRKVA